MERERAYLAIDLKSFYASVECVERGLDALTTNLVVADPTRTEKTICLAVSPSLKAYGIPGRPRLFEVIQKVNGVNEDRRRKAPRRTLKGSSTDDAALKKDPALALDYIVAPPQMARYMKVSAAIYKIYLRYIAPEDIHVYSIDEVFIDATAYLKAYRLTPRDLAVKLIREVVNETGITATAGIGTNLYLAKVAMDIVAKHIPADRDGVRIAELNERSYREKLWSHRPLTDFWRVGRGYAKKLEDHGLYTMGDIARCSLGEPYRYHSEELLYKLFGVNAELLIDHAWGWEPCTIAEIKAYRPENNSVGSGQVLSRPYDFRGGRLIVREMADLLALDLVEKGLVTDQVVLTVGYDTVGTEQYQGEYSEDRYGRRVPKSAHGSSNLGKATDSARLILGAVTELYERIVDPALYVRRIYVVANHVMSEERAIAAAPPVQLDFFTDPEETAREEKALAREKSVQKAIVSIKKKYGKNALLKGMDLEEGATTVERNGQVGGHKA
ncbi:MAG: DNA methylase [Bacteroides sp.]|nr:DNA methylase [Eubacterium sp.]MCM1417872.1 DNA methylase [Roseburia sp.]MCM1461311.1 DNA methylase [Bacteroides sp.]